MAKKKARSKRRNPRLGRSDGTDFDVLTAVERKKAQAQQAADAKKGIV